MTTPGPAFNFDELYADHGKPLYRFCLRLMGERAEAEDLAQDVFVAALVGKDKFRKDSSVRTWLFRIAVFKARDRQRQRKRETHTQEEIPCQDVYASERMAIEHGIEQLPAKLRNAFILVKAEQFTTAEAAEILGVPEGTVKYHVFEAIQRLRSALSPAPLSISMSKAEETNHAV